MYTIQYIEFIYISCMDFILTVNTKITHNNYNHYEALDTKTIITTAVIR